MDNLHSRISAVVSHFGLTKTEFAKRINIAQSMVSEMCAGKKKPSDRTISDICREFNVSESWLRTGEGDMLIPVTPDQKLAMALGHMVRNPQPSRKLLLRILMELPEEDLDRFVEKIREIIRETDAPPG